MKTVTKLINLVFEKKYVFSSLAPDNMTQFNECKLSCKIWSDEFIFLTLGSYRLQYHVVSLDFSGFYR